MKKIIAFSVALSLLFSATIPPFAEASYLNRNKSSAVKFANDMKKSLADGKLERKYDLVLVSDPNTADTNKMEFLLKNLGLPYRIVEEIRDGDKFNMQKVLESLKILESNNGKEDYSLVVLDKRGFWNMSGILAKIVMLHPGVFMIEKYLNSKSAYETQQ